MDIDGASTETQFISFSRSSSINQIKDIEGLLFNQCSYNGWDHAMAIGEVLFLLWGIRVCYNVRNAESLYNEAKLISYAIYNIAFVNMLMVAIQLSLKPHPTSNRF
jgi:G protein-coupled receptor 158